MVLRKNVQVLLNRFNFFITIEPFCEYCICYILNRKIKTKFNEIVFSGVYWITKRKPHSPFDHRNQENLQNQSVSGITFLTNSRQILLKSAIFRTQYYFSHISLNMNESESTVDFQTNICCQRYRKLTENCNYSYHIVITHYGFQNKHFKIKQNEKQIKL